MEAHCREKTERPENEIVVVVVVEYIIFYNIIVDEGKDLPIFVLVSTKRSISSFKPPILVGCLVPRQIGSRCCCNLVGRVAGHLVLVGWLVQLVG